MIIGGILAINRSADGEIPGSAVRECVSESGIDDFTFEVIGPYLIAHSSGINSEKRYRTVDVCFFNIDECQSSHRSTHSDSRDMQVCLIGVINDLGELGEDVRFDVVPGLQP